MAVCAATTTHRPRGHTKYRDEDGWIAVDIPNGSDLLWPGLGR
jgi:hypothetical protein